MHDSNNGASACVIFKQPLREIMRRSITLEDQYSFQYLTQILLERPPIMSFETPYENYAFHNYHSGSFSVFVPSSTGNIESDSILNNHDSNDLATLQSGRWRFAEDHERQLGTVRIIANSHPNEDGNEVNDLESPEPYYISSLDLPDERWILAGTTSRGTVFYLNAHYEDGLIGQIVFSNPKMSLKKT